MKRIVQVIIIIFLVLFAITAIGAGVFLVKWNQCTNTKSVPEITGTLFKTKEAGIGEKIPCTFQVKTSWSLMPVNANITPKEGMQEFREAEIKPGKWMWGTRLWNVTVWVQPYRDGDYPATPVSILCEGGPDGRAVVKAKIPGFKVKLAESDLNEKLDIEQQVSLSPEEKKNRRWIWYLCGAAVFVLGILIWLFIRTKIRGQKSQMPPWVTALNAISDLRATLSGKEISTENAVTKLTYIIRDYLAERFSLRAERQTTPEFLESMRSANSPLDVEQRQFLREFLTSADMVKFARMDTDEKMFEGAAERAESLIRTTSQTIEMKEEKS